MIGQLLKKDIRECVRTGKLIVFLALAYGIGIMIMIFSVVFTDLPDFLTEELAGFDIESLESMIGVLYPKMVKESMGVFSYYIGVFYSLITIILTHGILSKEIEGGKWTLLLQKGFRPGDFIISKCVTYGCMAGLSVFVSYISYFAVANTFMERNMNFGNAFVCATIHGLNLFFIIGFTIIISVSFRNPIVGAISMIGTVLFVPDLVNYFSFARYLPTYLLNFVYDGRSDVVNTLPAVLFNLVLLVMTYFVAKMRAEYFVSSSE